MTDIENPPKTSIWKSLEEWEKNVKKTLSNWILAPSQRIHSFNGRPYFMTLLFIYEIYSSVEITYFHINSEDTNLKDWIQLIYAFLGVFLPILFIGFPVEIAHGTLRTAVFCFLFNLYQQAFLMLILKEALNFLITNLSPCLISFHFANMVRNWDSISFKKTRIVFMIMFTFPINIWTFLESDLSTNFWRVRLVGYTCQIASILIGFVLGYYWAYSPPQPEEQQSRLQNWKNYAIAITILTAFFLIAELSEFHYSFDEWMFKNPEEVRQWMGWE